MITKDTERKASRSERLEARVSKAQKNLFLRAASLQGRSLTDFLITSVQEAAERAVRAHDVLTLSERDRKDFVAALLRPAEPGKALRQAAKRYKDRVGSSLPGEKDEARYRVEGLGRQHDRLGFSSGSEPLDHYLRSQAGQDARKRVAAPFVLCEGGGHTVLGYYTLSAISIDIGEWPETVTKQLPRYPVVPATLLGRLAIDRRLQGQGVGEYLLMDALHRSLQASRQVAALAIIVDAKDERAVTFYRRYEFIPFADQPTRLFLPMRVIERVFP